MKYLKILLGVIGAGVGISGYLLVFYVIARWNRSLDPWVFLLSGFVLVLATALLLSGVNGIRHGLRWVPLPNIEGQPWLKVENWRKREIVHGSMVHGIYLIIAYIGLGVPAVLCAWAAIDPPTGSEGNRLEGVLWALILVSWIAGLTYWWLRHRRYGDSTCRLLTLPGVIGGWFKADVVCTLPPDPATPVVVRLRNLVPAGKSVKEVWRLEDKLNVSVTGGQRSLVPVRFHIPRDSKQRVPSLNPGIKEALFGPAGLWVLEIEKQAAGVDFFAKFRVPIYDTTDAPPSEQLAEAQ